MRDLKVFHDSHGIYYRRPFGAVACKGEVLIRIRINASLSINSVILRLWKDESREELIDMKTSNKDSDDCIYEITINTPERPGLFWYYFIIDTDQGRFFYGKSQEAPGGEGKIYGHEPPSWQVTVYKQGLKTPTWLKNGIIYQIFVDRFHNGNGDGFVYKKRDDYIIHDNWDHYPNYKPDPQSGEIMNNDFFGGNLEGIIKKLPYLKELGVNILYLNPIFEAYSNHKYDTGNYKKVDPMFGDNEIFKKLCKKAKDMGISIILDGVFSHTGSDSIYFNREGTYESIGAYQSKESPYYPWYHFMEYPDKYDCWWGVETLPNVNEMEESYLEYIIKDKDSVIKYWLNQGAAGWRLDVADELPSAFLKLLRKAVKKTNPDAVIIGEVWEDASNKVSYGQRREYLLGDELDSVMNYPLRDMIIGFLLEKHESKVLNHGIMTLCEHYPKQCFYSLMNIIGTHDVTRIINILGEAPAEREMSKEEQAEYKMTDNQKELGIKRLKLASLIQMTLPGVPSIYYGDEAGVEGYSDPFNRRTYPWGRENKGIINWYRKIIALRNNTDALRTGDFIPVFFEGDVYGYLRRITNGRDVFDEEAMDGSVLVFINRHKSEDQVVEIDAKKYGIDNMVDIFDDEQCEFRGSNIRIVVPSLGYRVFVKE